jgi:hypothetical protein
VILCNDCGLDVPHDMVKRCWEPWTTAKKIYPGTHPGRCCDCFDEGWGMPPEFRSRPRKETKRPELT